MYIKNKLVLIFSAISKWRNPERNKTTLVSLAPNENIDDNQFYVELLNEQVDKSFDNAANKNIALSGEYGTGKSSIIRRFVKNHRKEAVIISFATLNSVKSKGEERSRSEGGQLDIAAPGDGGGNKIESTENGFTRPVEDLPLYSDSYGPTDRAEANGIQKEIVKQLMFREKSSALPHSKFSRAGEPNTGFSVSITVLLLLFGFIFSLNPIIKLVAAIEGRLPNIWRGVGIFLSVLIILAVAYCVYYVVLRTVGRLGIDKAGVGNVSLSFANSKNYFDDHLDEIIYLFEKNKFEIVIFEDLDRFDNILIFERLRALNTALNNAQGLKSRNIRFIYAMRDSLFDNHYIADAAISRAKFFDLIIPVVPFLTFENSLKYFKDNLPKEKWLVVKDPVIRLASEHITDMRLIHDICNEYKVFASQLNLKDSTLGLKPDNLFAMILFKNIYPTEFGDLKNRNNIIAQLAFVHDQEKQNKINNIQAEIAYSNTELKESSSYKDKITTYTQGLNTFLDELSQNDSYFTSQLLDADSNEVDRAFIDEHFWELLQEKEVSSTILQIRWSQNNYPRGSHPQFTHIQRITKKMVQDYIGEPIMLKEFTKTEATKVRESISAKKHLIEELRFSSFKEHFLIEAANRLGFKFRKALPNQHSLLSELIREGYIDDYYLQYYSTYRGRLSRDALYYRHEYIERGRYDMTRHLSDTDVKELIDSLDESYMSGPGMFNIDVIDYLIRNNDTRVLPLIVATLIESDDTAIKFVSEYEKSNKRDSELKLLIHKLSENGYKEIFNTVCSLEAISEQKRLSFINAAIEGSSNETQYLFRNDTAAYILANLQGVTTLTKKTKSPVVSHLVNAINILIQIGHRVDLKSLNGKAIEMIIQSNLYKITDDNLKIVTKSTNFSLDKIRFETTNGSEIYEYLLANIDEYINLLKSSVPKKFSICGVAGFENILDDVYNKGEQYLEDILSLADSSNCIIEDINKVSKNVWGFVISSENILVQSSLQNLIDYHMYSSPAENAELDDGLVKYLNVIEGAMWLDKKYDEYDESSRNNFLRAAMNSIHTSTTSKVNIVTALFKERGQTINIKFFDLQDGILYGDLLAAGVLADTIDSYEYLKNLDWETREHYLAHSTDAKEYLADILTIEDINNVLVSLKLDIDIKLAVVNSYELEDGSLSDNGAEAYAKIIIDNKMTPDLQIIEDIADKLTADSLVDIVNLLPSDTNKDSLKKIFSNSSDIQLNKISSYSRKRISLDENSRHIALLERLKSQAIIRSYGQSWWSTGLFAYIVE